MRKISPRPAKGQALITLLIVAAVGMTVTAATATLVIVNTMGTTRLQRGVEAMQVAESGMENALIRLLRDPAYSGETLSIGDGTATVTVSGSSPIVVRSQGRVGSYLRTVEARVEYLNNILSVSSWREVY